MKVFRPEADTFPAGGVNHRNKVSQKTPARRPAQLCVGLRPLMPRGPAAPVVYTTGIRCGALRAREFKSVESLWWFAQPELDMPPSELRKQ